MRGWQCGKRRDEQLASCGRLQAAEQEQSQSQLVHVRFSFDRTPLRRMHAALEHAGHPKLQLLPVSGAPDWAITVITKHGTFVAVVASMYTAMSTQLLTQD